VGGQKRRVVVIHDGSIDEYMAILLASKFRNICIDGIVVVAGNCLPDIGMQASWKLLKFLGRTEVPLLLSSARGYNPFPWPYREDCIKQINVSALRDYSLPLEWPPYPNAEQWLREYFRRVESKVTILCLCPVTPVAELLKEHPEVNDQIEQLIWMGGALQVAGNLDPATIPDLVANPYAEWNAFWDPEAVRYVFDHSTFPILLFPLDITNKVRITTSFLERLSERGKAYRCADLALQSYRQTSGAYYCMWDVTTAVFLDRPELYADPTRCKLEVITTGYKAGTLVQSSTGREVQAYTNVSNLEELYDHFIELFSVD
jgi:purine nucleosidase